MDINSYPTGSPTNCGSKSLEAMNQMNDSNISDMPSYHQYKDPHSCQTPNYRPILGGNGIIRSDIANENIYSLSQSIIPDYNSCSENDNQLSNTGTIYIEI